MRELRIIFYFSFLLFFLVISLHPQDASSAQVTLAWDPNIEPEVTGYKLYYGTSSRNYSEVIDVGDITNYTVYNLTYGITYYFAVKAYNSYGLKSDYSNEVSVPVDIISPDGGEIILSGSIYTIAWEAVLKAVKFNLMFSLDNGLTWIPIENGVEDKNYDWTVPKPWGNQKGCLLKVVGYTASGVQVGAGKSYAPFMIEVVKLTSPNGGETFMAGGTYIMTWQTNGTKRDVEEVSLYYTKNGGVTWHPVCDSFTGECMLSGNPETYEWTVPKVEELRDTCKIRVMLKDADGNVLAQDGSDDYFSIQP